MNFYLCFIENYDWKVMKALQEKIVLDNLLQVKELYLRLIYNKKNLKCKKSIKVENLKCKKSIKILSTNLNLQ